MFYEKFARLALEIEAQKETICHLRHTIHRFPELSNEEFETTKRVATFLEGLGLGLRVQGRTSGVGLVVDSGSADGPRIAIRADLDALAVTEQTNLPWASEKPGLMHACGHDVHTSCLAGAIGALVRVAPDLPFRFIFQHAEEVNPGGAIDLINEGALEGVSCILAMHCDPSREVGHFAIQEGPITAANDQFWIEILGRGGHGARPHEAQDTILAAAQILQAIYHAFDRSLDARHPFVISTGVIKGGDKSPNVLPDRVLFGGSIRSLFPDDRKSIEPILRRVLDGMTAAMGLRYTLSIRPGAPGVINHPDITEALRTSVRSLFGASALSPVGLPSMGGEDFAWFAQHVPGAMIRVGTGKSTPLHSGSFVAQDAALPLASHVLAHAALSLAFKGEACSTRRF